MERKRGVHAHQGHQPQHHRFHDDRDRGRGARAAASPGTEILAVSSASGPVSIEGHYDEAVSVIGLLEEVRAGEREGYAMAM